MNMGNLLKLNVLRRLPFVSKRSCLASLAAGLALLMVACSAPSAQVPGTGSSSSTLTPVSTMVQAAPTTAATANATLDTPVAFTPISTTGSGTGTPSAQSTAIPITVLPATSQPGVVNTLTPPANGATTPTAAAGTPAATGEGTTVTLADDGKTITLKVGQRFLLDLGPDANWTPTVANQNIVSRVIGITVINGAQGVYQADAPGTTTLMVNGEPTCRKAKPACAMPDRLFSVTIVVQP